MAIALTWLHEFNKMGPFLWILAIIAIGALIAIVAVIVDGIRRIYKIRLIHHERLAMIEKGMDPGPFVEGTGEKEEDTEDAGVSPQHTGQGSAS